MNPQIFFDIFMVLDIFRTFQAFRLTVKSYRFVFNF